MTRMPVFLIVGLIVAASAEAQPLTPPHPQSIGLGAQWAPMSYSEPRVRAGFEVSWRRWYSPHLGFGSIFRHKRRHEITEFDSPEQTGSSGFPVLARKGRNDERHTSSSLAADLLARMWIGRVTFVGGIGAGFLDDTTVVDEVFNQAHERRKETQTSFKVHGIGEVEVRAISRLLLYAGFRADGGYGHLAGGFRCGF